MARNWLNADRFAYDTEAAAAPHPDIRLPCHARARTRQPTSTRRCPGIRKSRFGSAIRISPIRRGFHSRSSAIIGCDEKYDYYIATVGAPRTRIATISSKWNSRKRVRRELRRNTRCGKKIRDSRDAIISDDPRRYSDIISQRRFARRGLIHASLTGGASE